jgi:hypothetical protein
MKELNGRVVIRGREVIEGGKKVDGVQVKVRD